MSRFRLITVLCLEVIFFALFVGGIIPRVDVRWYALAIVIYVSFVPLEEALFFFIASIPLMIAIPIDLLLFGRIISFDSLNIWRLLSIVIFLRWVPRQWPAIISSTKDFFMRPLSWCRRHHYVSICMVLFLLACLSLIGSTYPIVGIRRLVLFLNAALVPIVFFDVVRGRRELLSSYWWAITLSAIIALGAGYYQSFLTYRVTINSFVSLWAEGIQCVQFGIRWCSIALWQGNTWFGYNGDNLILRVFSLFPDSHSYPTFLLLGLPAVAALALRRIPFDSFTRAIRARASMLITLVPLLFLGIILSGTRGYWAAWFGVSVIALWYIWRIRPRVAVETSTTGKYIFTFLGMFPLLFLIAWPIFSSPQFQLEGESGRLGKRIHSIIDLGETSNRQRILIWRASATSIARHPVLGVGFGNFPVVLSQDISAAKAGSSAHNLYLQIAAELGIPALLVFLYFLYKLLRNISAAFQSERDNALRIFWGTSLLSFMWVLLYVMTDPIIFDERVFLIFGSSIAMILGAIGQKQSYESPTR